MIKIENETQINDLLKIVNSTKPEDILYKFEHYMDILNKSFSHPKHWMEYFCELNNEWRPFSHANAIVCPIIRLVSAKCRPYTIDDISIFRNIKKVWGFSQDYIIIGFEYNFTSDELLFSLNTSFGDDIITVDAKTLLNEYRQLNDNCLGVKL